MQGSFVSETFLSLVMLDPRAEGARHNHQRPTSGSLVHCIVTVKATEVALMGT